MSSVKTYIDSSIVKSFLIQKYGVKDLQLATVSGGERSQAYFFALNKEDLVIRVNAQEDFCFHKDHFVAKQLANTPVPVPKIIEIGTLPSGEYYAISKRANGKTIALHSQNEMADIQENIVVVQSAIHQTKPFGTGYGRWDLTGNGKDTSWAATINWFRNELLSPSILEVGFVDEEIHIELFDLIGEYMQYCPETRMLVHGDFGNLNVLGDAGVITGVIDWAQAMYGDPLYDAAWVDFWNEGYNFETQFKRHYLKKGALPSNFHERMACYKFLHATEHLCFCARTGQDLKYNICKAKIARINLPLQNEVSVKQEPILETSY